MSSAMLRLLVRGALHDAPKGTTLLSALMPGASATVAKSSVQAGRRAFAASAGGGSNLGKWALAAAVAGGGYAAYSAYGGASNPLAPGPVIEKVEAKTKAPESKPGDYAAVRKAISDILEKEGYDDGSYGPVLVRLAWHASGTYDKVSKTGGSNGATMRYAAEANYGANSGLNVARELLDPVKARFPWISYADLWTLAGAVAIEELGGPPIKWKSGRIDKLSELDCPPDGRLPDATKGAQHIRDIFYRMGFNDQEIVALSGAHCLGRCHRTRSGFDGPWTNAPTTFSNLYFTELTDNKWTKKKWDGPLQYEDTSKQLMMLPTDMALIQDKKFLKYVKEYAKDGDKFFNDFAAAFSKLLELGVPFPNEAEITP